MTSRRRRAAGAPVRPEFRRRRAPTAGTARRGLRGATLQPRRGRPGRAESGATAVATSAYLAPEYLSADGSGCAMATSRDKFRTPALIARAARARSRPGGSQCCIPTHTPSTTAPSTTAPSTTAPSTATGCLRCSPRSSASHPGTGQAEPLRACPLHGDPRGRGNHRRLGPSPGPSPRCSCWCGGEVTVGAIWPGADARAEGEAGLVSAGRLRPFAAVNSLAVQVPVVESRRL
jgi:hypothetical protein